MGSILSKGFKAENHLLGSEGAKLLTFYTCAALGLPILCPFLIRSLDTLASIQSYVFGFIGAMNVALMLWVRRMPK